MENNQVPLVIIQPKMLNVADIYKSAYCTLQMYPVVLVSVTSRLTHIDFSRQCDSKVILFQMQMNEWIHLFSNMLIFYLLHIAACFEEECQENAPKKQN